MSDVSGLLSLYNLLSRASNVSCLKGASAFLSLPTTEDVRFSLAIDGFIPALQNQGLQIPQRILAAFVLHALYVSHDHQNPFHDHLLRIFESERAIAIAASRIRSSFVGSSQRALESPQDRNEIQAENEQLVWVLWKILQGEGNDLAQYSPNMLSSVTLPEHLRPLQLNLHGSFGHGNGTHFHPRRSPPEFPQPSHGSMGPLTSQNSTILFQTRNPSSVSGPSRTGTAPRLLANRTPSISEFSPVDVTFPASSGSIMQQAPGIPFAQQRRTPTPTRVSPPTRSPGVIGSGRPSASVAKSDTSADHNTTPSRWSQIGIIGNGRPESSVVAGHGSLAHRGTDARREHESMIPFSVLRMRSMKEESEKREHGIIGQAETDLGDDNRRKSNGQTDERMSLLEKLTALSIERKAQEPSQEGDITSFKPPTQASERNWPPRKDNPESVPIFAPSVALQRQAMPLPPSATAFYPQPVSAPVSAGQNVTYKAASVSPLHPSSALPSVPAIEHGPSYQSSKSSQPSPFYISRREETSKTHINEKQRDELSHAIFLLLSARERVLTLTEQRLLQPHLSILTQPLSLLRPGDIPPLVAKNTDIAAKLLLFLLDRNDEDAERIERVVKDASKNSLFHLSHGSLDAALPLPAAESIDSMAAVDAIQAMVNFVNTCGAPSNSVGTSDVSPFGGREAKEGYLDAIRKLPPTMQSFNLIAKLLRPTHHRDVTSEQQEDLPEVRVAILIKTEVLGGFMSGCVRWIEHVEQEEKEGKVHDNRVAIAIASLCRFYSSLLKHGFVSAASEADATEMMSFALQFSRFEEARSLYSTLAAART